MQVDEPPHDRRGRYHTAARTHPGGAFSLPAILLARRRPLAGLLAEIGAARDDRRVNPEHNKPSVPGDASSERRQRRSDDVVTALHYQLASARAEAGLEALVLVDDRGSLLASAGAWAPCEELAAFAPLLARPEEVARSAVAGRLAALAEDTTSLALGDEHAPILLCGRGRGAKRHAMVRAAEGCLRILAA